MMFVVDAVRRAAPDHACSVCLRHLYGVLQAQKNLIESMIAEDDKIEGLEHVECKVFK